MERTNLGSIRLVAAGFSGLIVLVPDSLYPLGGGESDTETRGLTVKLAYSVVASTL